MISVFESLPGLYLILKPDAPRFTIEAVSDAYTAATLTKREDIVGKGVFEVFPDNPDNPEAKSVANLTASLQKVLRTKKPHTLAVIKYDIPLPKGGFEERFWSPTNTPVIDSGGKVCHIINSVTDITEVVLASREKQADKHEIFQLLQRHNTLFEQDFVAIAVLRGLDYVIEQTNPLVCQIWGRSHKQLIDKPLFEALPEAAGQGLEELLQGVFKTGKPYIGTELPIKLKRKGNKLETVYFNFIYIPMKGANNKVTGITVLANDVTEQVNVRISLIESEQRFRNLADTAPMYIAMADETGNAVYFNKPWLEFTGKKMPEMQGLGWLSTLHPEDAPKFEKDFKHAFSKRITINKQYRFRRADGEYRWMLAVGAPRFTADGRFIGYYGTYTDFHELKMAQLAVQESEGHFRAMADNVPNLAWMANPDGWIFWYNKRWYDYTGTTLEEMQGWGWQKVHHPDHVKRIVEFVKEAWPKGEPFELNFPLRRHDGQYRWFLTRVFPIKDKRGNVERWIGTNTDIEDLRQRHQIEQRMKLLTEQRNALMQVGKSKDEFIALASHQLRTPATAVKQYISLVMEGFVGPVTKDQLEFLQIALDSNERQLRIINDLLKTAQLDTNGYELNMQRHNLLPLIHEVISDMGSTLELKKQKVEFKCSEKKVDARVDATEMKVVFANLLENASKYSRPGTEIKITLRKKAGLTEIIVKDQGVGIGQGDLVRIFDKFTRIDNELSDTVTGNGLGLYWVKQLVELHGGSIEVTSRSGKGSEFIVRLPK